MLVVTATRGRPPALPVRTTPLSDDEAFWRIKATTGDSWKAMRTVGFCAFWQKYGGSVDGLIAAGVMGRATIYNRLKECHQGGFEPGLVRFTLKSPQGWMARERALVDEIKQAQLELDEFVPKWIRWLTGPPEDILGDFLAGQPD